MDVRSKDGLLDLHFGFEGPVARKQTPVSSAEGGPTTATFPASEPKFHVPIEYNIFLGLQVSV